MPRSARTSIIARIAAIAMLAAASTPSSAATPQERELIRLEQAYANALIRKDVAFLQLYYAPDWRGGDWMGFGTKLTLINLLRDRRYVIASMKLRGLTVRVIGSVAIVQGIDDEISSMHGKDTSGSWGFTDIFERRGKRWVAIASQTTKITGPR